MSTSIWNQSEVFRRVAILAETSQMRNISADPISLYSDNFLDENFEWDLAVNKSIRSDPHKLIIALLVLSSVKPFWYHLFLNYCGDQAYRYKYQGKWFLLHRLCKMQTIILQLQIVQERMNPEDFFGDFIEQMESFAENPTVHFIKQTKPKSKSPQRKRGYNDKGSMKFPHEVHSAWRHTGPNPSRPDFRSSYKKKMALVNYLYD